jgi:hypothetical protein
LFWNFIGQSVIVGGFHHALMACCSAGVLYLPAWQPKPAAKPMCKIQSAVQLRFVQPDLLLISEPKVGVP